MKTREDADAAGVDAPVEFDVDGAAEGGLPPAAWEPCGLCSRPAGFKPWGSSHGGDARSHGHRDDERRGQVNGELSEALFFPASSPHHDTRIHGRLRARKRRTLAPRAFAAETLDRVMRRSVERTAVFCIFLAACGTATQSAVGNNNDDDGGPLEMAVKGQPQVTARYRDGKNGSSDSARAVATAPTGPTQRVRVDSGQSSRVERSQSYEDRRNPTSFRGLTPDIVVIQEFNYQGGDPSRLSSIPRSVRISTSTSSHERAGFPNGVVSRYPIIKGGTWNDPNVPDRSFVYAQIDVPGPIDLWAVSLHLLTTGATQRDTEAKELVTYIQGTVPAGDYLIVGGDLNTDTADETALTDLAASVVTKFTFPLRSNGKTTSPASTAIIPMIGYSRIPAYMAARSRRESARRPTRMGSYSTVACTRRSAK